MATETSLFTGPLMTAAARDAFVKLDPRVLIRKLYGPWHDVTMLVDGGAARALGELGRMRWVAAGGEPLDECAIRDVIWPKSVEPMFRNVEVGIARTRGEYQNSPEIREIEALFVDLIAGAKHFIYVENQYFASRKVAEAIAARMVEPDPPEVILVTAANADGWLEQQAMDTARARLVDAIHRVDHRSRFRIYHPVTAGGEPIYVHAKLMIVDDHILRVGSANMNNRSLGLDSECDLVLGDMHGCPESVNATISALRMRLMAEHLGVDVARIASLVDAGETPIAIVEALRGNARSLVPFVLPELTVTQIFVADNEVLDPEAAGALFEPFAKRRLFRRKRLPKPATA
jgi:phosphatidylserine/phosphatidylglycerophosphate/cardiolipin synthase-like enzyme